MSTGTSADTHVTPEAAPPSTRTSWWRDEASEPVRRNLGLVGVLIVLIIIGVVTRPDLYSDPNWVRNNIFTILMQASAIGVVTVGMTFVIIGGGIDLSVGAIMAIAGVWATTQATQSFGAGGMIFTAIAVGTAVGIINGTLISYGRLVPFIATLAMLVAFNWVLLLRVLPSFEAYKPSVPVSDVIRREASPDDVVMHFDVALPSMVYYLRRHIDITFDPEQLHRQIKSDRKVLAVLPAHRYPQLKLELGVPTCELARYPTGEIRLRDLLELKPHPEVVLITNRCPAGTSAAVVE